MSSPKSLSFVINGAHSSAAIARTDFVRYAGLEFGYVDNVVASFAKVRDDLALYALVTEQIQAASPGPG